jgi:hypothetical protein
MNKRDLFCKKRFRNRAINSLYITIMPIPAIGVIWRTSRFAEVVSHSAYRFFYTPFIKL